MSQFAIYDLDTNKGILKEIFHSTIDKGKVVAHNFGVFVFKIHYLGQS